MESRERFLSSQDSHQIPFLHWPAENPSAVLIIAHGMAEHAGRYGPIARWLADQGVSVYAIQHRGHGPHCPPNQRGHYADKDGWHKVIDDLHRLIVLAKDENPGLPINLFGHSMGSFICQALVQEHGEEVDNVLLCATNRIDRIKLNASLALVRGIAKLRNVRFPSKLIEMLTFDTFNKEFAPNRTTADWLSRDAQQVDAYLDDELCGFLCTVGLWGDFISGMLNLEPKTWRKDLPIHLMAGDEDPVGEMGKGVTRHGRNLRKAGVTVASERLFPGARHELVNEINADEIWQHIFRCIRTVA